MINICEENTKKLSGITSLHISFDFNQEVINVIKQFSKYKYDKKTFTLINRKQEHSNIK